MSDLNPKDVERIRARMRADQGEYSDPNNLQHIITVAHFSGFPLNVVGWTPPPTPDNPAPISQPVNTPPPVTRSPPTKPAVLYNDDGTPKEFQAGVWNEALARLGGPSASAVSALIGRMHSGMNAGPIDWDSARRDAFAWVDSQPEFVAANPELIEDFFARMKEMEELQTDVWDPVTETWIPKHETTPFGSEGDVSGLNVDQLPYPGQEHAPKQADLGTDLRDYGGGGSFVDADLGGPGGSGGPGGDNWFAETMAAMKDVPGGEEFMQGFAEGRFTFEDFIAGSGMEGGPDFTSFFPPITTDNPFVEGGGGGGGGGNNVTPGFDWGRLDTRFGDLDTRFSGLEGLFSDFDTRFSNLEDLFSGLTDPNRLSDEGAGTNILGLDDLSTFLAGEGDSPGGNTFVDRFVDDPASDKNEFGGQASNAILNFTQPDLPPIIDDRELYRGPLADMILGNTGAWDILGQGFIDRLSAENPFAEGRDSILGTRGTRGVFNPVTGITSEDVAGTGILGMIERDAERQRDRLINTMSVTNKLDTPLFPEQLQDFEGRVLDTIGNARVGFGMEHARSEEPFRRNALADLLGFNQLGIGNLGAGLAGAGADVGQQFGDQQDFISSTQDDFFQGTGWNNAVTGVQSDFSDQGINLGQNFISNLGSQGQSAGANAANVFSNVANQAGNRNQDRTEGLGGLADLLGNEDFDFGLGG